MHNLPFTVTLPNLPDAACIDYPNPDDFFPQTSGPRSLPPNIVALCGRCPERLRCLTWAVEHNEDGVWAASTDDDRRRMSDRPLTQETRRRAVRRMNADGLDDGQIAAELGVSRSVVATDRGALRLGAGGKYSRSEIARRHQTARELHALGLSDPQIAERLGVDRSTARSYRRQMGLTANTGGDAA